MTRRNPQSANPRRRGGPPPPAGSVPLTAEQKAAVRRWRLRRGCLEGAAANYVEALRRARSWWHVEQGLPTPDWF